MANFTAHSAFKTTSIPLPDDATAQFTAATPTTWGYADASVSYLYTGTGFTFDPEGDLATGTVTGLDVSVNGALVASVSGAQFETTGPNSPESVTGHDIWDEGYLNDTGYPVFYAEADLAWMLRGNDQVNGSAQADVLAGYEGNDQIAGNGGNDVLRGWSGNDTIDGGAGTDIAAYLSFRSNVSVHRAGESWTTTAAIGVDETDTLTHVERLVFHNNEAVALDLDGAAGRVAKLLGAVFGAGAVENEAFVGLGLHYADMGLTDEALAQLALGARGVTTHEAVVQTLWLNVIGSPIDGGNLATYVGMLEGGMSHGALALMASDTSFNTANIDLAGLSGTGLAYLFHGTLG
jgi:hypothetical protein